MSDAKLNLLIAYPYWKNDVAVILKAAGDDIRLVVDSGAFTAWKAGKVITAGDYAKFIHHLPVTPWRYFTLDVIGDPARSLENYDALRKDGLKPVPIFTRGDDIRMIDRYYETSDLLGVGGLVGTKGNKGFVKGIMQRIGKRNVHWLGFTSQDFIQVYNPYMCDSSSWAGAVRFGSIKVYMGAGRWTTVNKSSFMKRPDRLLCDLLKGYGINPEDLAQKAHWINSGTGKSAMELLTCRSWVRYSADIERQFGTKLFLAVACGWQAKLMHDAHNFWKGKR